MNIAEDIHKIAFEKDEAGGLILKFWKKGFAFDSPASGMDYVSGISIFELCQTLENEYNFSVVMNSKAKGQAIRGEDITRIDFIMLPEGVKVSKYPSGWNANTRPFSEIKPANFDLQAAVDWCKKNDWIVNEKNNQHIIAQKGTYHPIRSREQILSRRRYLNNNCRIKSLDKKRYKDLAYTP